MKQELIGKSSHHKKLLDFIQKAAKTDVNVLLLGETGVGKELAARRIHLLSARKSNSFIKINCANINKNLLESELFGHKKGAYTGAVADRLGLIEKADKGTFFLDEIADISQALQAKLLSVIEDKEFRRLGENKTKYVDVHFIFATNKNLSKLMAKEKFRTDLFYRINILNFTISPLREKKTDIQYLTEYFIRRESRALNKPFTISTEAMGKLMRHSFPGNVRELENVLKRATILSDNHLISEENIQFTNTKKAMRNIQKIKYPIDKIIGALVKHNGNKTKAAKELGISRVHLYRLLSNSRNNQHETH